MKFFNSRRKLDVSIDNIYTAQGIKISITKENELINIPFTFTVTELKQLDKLIELQLLEDLYADGLLTLHSEGVYLLPYKNIYDFSPEERELLNIPAKTTSISIKLNNEKYVGSSEFKFIPEISSANINRLHLIGKRKGAVIELPTKEVLLLEKPFYHFFELLDSQPIGGTAEEEMAYVAEVKKEANALNIELNKYIQNENYEFIDELDIELKRREEGIEILPQYKHKSLDRSTLDELSESSEKYVKKENKRILVKENVTRANEKIQNIPIIENKDIPHLAQNPASFYDEVIGISLEDFSDRVKDLNIRVYKAQPFINANQNERGWFEYEAGFKIKDAEGNEITTHDESYFQDANEEAFKQLDDNTFIELPDQMNEFQEIAKKVKEDASSQPESQASLSKYILEIFENFSKVEYNKPLSSKKEELQKENIFEVLPPKGFKAILKPFQEEGFKWMKTLRATGNGGLLADDMGLGKTIQVIAYLLYLKEQKKLTPTLIVLPKTLIENWMNEIKKFAPSLTEKIYKNIDGGRLKEAKAISTFDIVLTTYHTLARDQLILGKVDWEMVICDEAQAIKNPTTANSNVIKALKNKGRLALTGTPVENNLTELWSIIDFVQPGLFGSLKNFRTDYEKRLQNEQAYEEVQTALENRMKFVYLRRTKSTELKGQLPEKSEVKMSVAIGKEQGKQYQEIISNVYNDSMSRLQAIQKLKMVCSHPGLIDENLKDINTKQVPKLHKTMQIIKEIKEQNEKVIIFTEYRQMQSILRKEILKVFDINAFIINGTTGHRQEIVDKFNRGTNFDALILSPKAAGTGLTITSANHVIHYTRWWNPAVENQATDRVYRIGQTRDVYVYYPIVAGGTQNKTVEEVMDELLNEKKALAENVIVPSKGMDIEQEILKQMNL